MANHFSLVRLTLQCNVGSLTCTRTLAFNVHVQGFRGTRAWVTKEHAAGANVARGFANAQILDHAFCAFASASSLHNLLALSLWCAVAGGDDARHYRSKGASNVCNLKVSRLCAACVCKRLEMG